MRLNDEMILSLRLQLRGGSREVEASAHGRLQRSHEIARGESCERCCETAVRRIPRLTHEVEFS